MATPRVRVRAGSRVLIESVRMEGYLTKQGHKFKTWKRRWCVLKGDGLRYYKSIKHSRPQGIIPLRGISVENAPPTLKKDLAFQVNTSDPSKPVYYFVADSDAERQRWTKAIQEVANHQKGGKRAPKERGIERTTRQTISLTVAEQGKINMTYPGRANLTLRWVKTLINRLKDHGEDAERLKVILSEPNVKKLLADVREVLATRPNLSEVTLQPGVTVTLCGDIHGQFYDLYNIIKINGLPSETHWIMMNGDYVDRGSWGLECVLALFALKVLYPDYIHMSRGNHETRECSSLYGFADEVEHKFSAALYDDFVECFNHLPVAGLIHPAPKFKKKGGILCMHGGLFRKNENEIGDVAMINTWNRIREPIQGSPLDDMLWSDPQNDPGFEYNAARDCGIVFGPDVTAGFLSKNNLSLIVRSHEGPDAREKRPYMKPMSNGYTIDHIDKSGKPILCTLFSAPNYPEINPRGNKAAVCKIGPDLVPAFLQYEEVEHPPSQFALSDDEDGGEDEGEVELEGGDESE